MSAEPPSPAAAAAAPLTLTTIPLDLLFRILSHFAAAAPRAPRAHPAARPFPILAGAAAAHPFLALARVSRALAHATEAYCGHLLRAAGAAGAAAPLRGAYLRAAGARDRKSTRLNSSHKDTSRMPSSA